MFSFLHHSSLNRRVNERGDGTFLVRHRGRVHWSLNAESPHTPVEESCALGVIQYPRGV